MKQPIYKMNENVSVLVTGHAMHNIEVKLQQRIEGIIVAIETDYHRREQCIYTYTVVFNGYCLRFAENDIDPIT